MADSRAAEKRAGDGKGDWYQAGVVRYLAFKYKFNKNTKVSHPCSFADINNFKRKLGVNSVFMCYNMLK